MMIIPLPTFLLDILITLNITLAVVLLLVAIYISDALRIATFPTILLITTLYRLALNVSSTRLILLQANAGRVIRSFGEFVVRGNYVVGAVVFLILTLIQYIVIAKGGERIAEVAARFTLDAMPGKQMAIDADLRAGAIDLEEARRRRTLLQRESQLYGSMDGAMKFVKGDAIAGILITIINIVGGLIIGVAQRGLSLSEAARVYTLLTIGDGLVSQIPALLLSTAAGLIVTRVASEDEGAHLGYDIGAQVLAHPKALGIAAALLAVLGVVPGLPLVPFWILAAATGATAWALVRSRRRAQAAVAATPALPAPGVAPLVIEVADDLLAAAREPRLSATLRERLFEELGVPLPPLEVRSGSASLSPGDYVIWLKEIPMARGTALGPDAVTELTAHALAVLRRHAGEFVGLAETQALLDSLARVQPTLVRALVPAKIEPGLLADVLRRLLAEEISIRNLPDILQVLAEAARADSDPAVLTEQVRQGALRRWITYRFTDGAATLEAFLLDPAIEDALKGALHKTDHGSMLALEPELSQDILAAVRARVAETPVRRPVIVTSAELRRHVRQLVQVECPELSVLSYQELAPELVLAPLGHIGTTA